MIDTERERGRDTGGGRSRLHAGSTMRDSIPGHDPGTPGSRPRPKAGAKQLRHPGIPLFSFFFFKIFISLFMRERGRDTGRGRSRLHAGSPTWDSWDSISGPQDHTLGQRWC